MGIILAITFLYLDSVTGYTPKGRFRVIFSGSSESARSILSAISGAMINVAGTVFSITLVVLTLASSQFGPRLLRNFMYKRINQVVLGSFASTYLYCLLVLNAVKGSDDFTFVPNISVLFALFLAVINIVLLIVFIHSVSVSIQTSQVVKSIGEDFEHACDNIFPSGLGKDSSAEPATVLEGYGLKKKIHSENNGYIQFIDEKIIKLASEKDLVVHLLLRPGEYVGKNFLIAELYSKTTVENSLIQEVATCFQTDRARSKFEDTEFAIHQLDEIAVRALSPGINDPYTAINCIDILNGLLYNVMNMRFPTAQRADDKGNLRLITNALTFESFVDASFNQIRQFGSTIPAVIIHLAKSLLHLHNNCTIPEHKKIIYFHINKVFEAGREQFKNSYDIADLNTIMPVTVE